MSNKTRNGAGTIVTSVRKICRIVGIYGINGFRQATSPELAAAVQALVVACLAFEQLDDKPFVVDNTPPLGPEDIGGTPL